MNLVCYVLCLRLHLDCKYAHVLRHPIHVDDILIRTRYDVTCSVRIEHRASNRTIIVHAINTSVFARYSTFHASLLSQMRCRAKVNEHVCRHPQTLSGSVPKGLDEYVDPNGCTHETLCERDRCHLPPKWLWALCHVE